MRNRKTLGFFALIIFITCSFYAWRTTRDVKPVSPPVAAVNPRDVQARTPLHSGMPGSGRLPRVPYAGPAFDPHKEYPPGEYIPRGFARNFREQIKMDFGDVINSRLGKDFPAEKRKLAAAVQDAFWDEHGPNVDLFAEGKITQPEFAERTHLATTHYSEGMGKVFSDDEYLSLFDMPKDVDGFYQLYHSKDEQPGMRMKPEDSQVHTAGGQPSGPAPGVPSGGELIAGYPAPPPGQSKGDVVKANPNDSSGSDPSPSSDLPPPPGGQPAPAPPKK